MYSTHDNWLGIGLFLLVMLGNAITIVLVRHLCDIADYSPFQLVFITNAIGAALCLPFWRGQRFRIEQKQTKLLAFRACLEFISFSASFYAISQLPLPMHTALLFMSPIFGSIIALAILREHGNRVAYACIAIGFGGMLIVTRPASMDGNILYGASFALLAALGFASCAAVIKVLTRQNPPRRIARNMLWMTSAFAAPFALAHWQPVAPAHWPFFAALGLLAFFLQHTVAMALSRVPLMTVIPLNFAQLAMVSVLAWMAFNQSVSGYTLLGASVILCATIFNAWYGSRHAKEMAAKEDIQSNTVKDVA